MNRVALQVRDYMTRDLVTVSPETDVTQAVSLMIERDISGLLVVDEAGNLAGIFTERDCIKVASEAGYYDEWGGPVVRYMSTAVESVAPGDNLIDVAAQMVNSSHRRFPVIDDGRLVGILSRRDVLRAIGTGSWR